MDLRIDPKTGESTGIKFPYIVTLDEGTGKFLAIKRNWDEQDQTEKTQRLFRPL